MKNSIVSVWCDTGCPHGCITGSRFGLCWAKYWLGKIPVQCDVRAHFCMRRGRKMEVIIGAWPDNGVDLKNVFEHQGQRQRAQVFICDRLPHFERCNILWHLNNVRKARFSPHVEMSTIVTALYGSSTGVRRLPSLK